MDFSDTAAIEDIEDWITDHNHAHACSNNPGGFICGKHCIAQALWVWVNKHLTNSVPHVEEALTGTHQVYLGDAYGDHPIDVSSELARHLAGVAVYAVRTSGKDSP